ncbi:hypothetical protein HK405_012152 [Cladochytrium tenue]|nr:hypothetical protein HK405_012152 [Cladochytrium tenue]
MPVDGVTWLLVLCHLWPHLIASDISDTPPPANTAQLPDRIRQLACLQATTHPQPSMSPSAPASSPPDPRLADTIRSTALAVIAAYGTWDIDQIMALRADDCVHRILPVSLREPPRNNRAYRRYFERTLPSFSRFSAEVRDICVDTAARTACLWVTSSADSVAGPYANEYFFWIRTTDDGRAVVEVREFVDSAYSLSVFKKIAAARAKL